MNSIPQRNDANLSPFSPLRTSNRTDITLAGFDSSSAPDLRKHEDLLAMCLLEEVWIRTPDLCLRRAKGVGPS